MQEVQSEPFFIHHADLERFATYLKASFWNRIILNNRDTFESIHCISVVVTICWSILHSFYHASLNYWFIKIDQIWSIQVALTLYIPNKMIFMIFIGAHTVRIKRTPKKCNVIPTVILLRLFKWTASKICYWSDNLIRLFVTYFASLLSDYDLTTP